MSYFTLLNKFIICVRILDYVVVGQSHIPIDPAGHANARVGPTRRKWRRRQLRRYFKHTSFIFLIEKVYELEEMAITSK